jgi:hypothetical protein
MLTEDDNIAMAEISYPVDANGSEVGHLSDETVKVISDFIIDKVFAPARFPRMLTRTPVELYEDEGIVGMLTGCKRDP